MQFVGNKFRERIICSECGISDIPHIRLITGWFIVYTSGILSLSFFLENVTKGIIGI